MTEGAVKVAVHRLRQRYRQLLREEIANTVATPAEVDEEMHHLFAVLAALKRSSDSRAAPGIPQILPEQHAIKALSPCNPPVIPL